MSLIKRRLFLKISTVAIVGVIVSLWDKMTAFQLKYKAKSEISVPFDENKMFSFYDGFIVVNNGDETAVYSSSCTHLGCEINKIENGKLVCPCHGSLFDINGNAVKGPAYRSLKKLPYKFDNEKKQIIVSVA
jgi:Rieske Fe-S protein